MKRAKPIHNLDNLEREIYRLKLAVKKIEEKLDHNLGHLQENYVSIVLNSFFGKKKNKEERKSGFFDTGGKSACFNTAANKITGHIADRAADGINHLLDKLFQKRK